MRLLRRRKKNYIFKSNSAPRKDGLCADSVSWFKGCRMEANTPLMLCAELCGGVEANSLDEC